MIRYFLTRQFVKFLMVGGLAAFLHWLARYLLSLWMPFAWAVALAYGVGIAVAFALNSLYVFPDSIKPRAAQARDFLLVNLAFFPVVWAASIAIDHGLRSLGFEHYSEGMAHAIAICIPVFATFLIYKFMAFREATDE